MTGGRGTRFFRQGFAGSAMHPVMSEMTPGFEKRRGVVGGAVGQAVACEGNAQVRARNVVTSLRRDL